LVRVVDRPTRCPGSHGCTVCGLPAHRAPEARPDTPHPRGPPARDHGSVHCPGWAGYVAAMLLSTEWAIGPVAAGRSVPWLVLQVLAAGTVAVAAVTAVTWWRANR